MYKLTMTKFYQRAGLAGVLAVGATASQAAFDTAPIVAEIAAVAAPIGLIGAALMLIYVAIKAIKLLIGFLGK